MLEGEGSVIETTVCLVNSVITENTCNESASIGIHSNFRNGFLSLDNALRLASEVGVDSRRSCKQHAALPTVDGYRDIAAPEMLDIQ